MKYPNAFEAQRLKNWELTPAGLDIEIFVPVGKVEAYRKRNIDIKPFSIPISEFSGSQWCRIFNVEEVSSPGILLRAIEFLREKGEAYSFEEILSEIARNPRSDETSKGAAENYFRAVNFWSLF